LKTLIQPTSIPVTFAPLPARTSGLESCGICHAETYVTLVVNDDTAPCCRRCFRQARLIRKPAR
jgi:hypothetical protein